MTLSGLVGFLLFLLKIIDLDLAFSLISGSAELLNHTSIKAFPSKFHSYFVYLPFPLHSFYSPSAHEEFPYV